MLWGLVGIFQKLHKKPALEVSFRFSFFLFFSCRKMLTFKTFLLRMVIKDKQKSSSSAF